MPIRKIRNTWYTDLHINGKRIRKRLSKNKITAQKIHDDLVKQQDFAPFGMADDHHDIKHMCKRFLLEVEPRVNTKTLHDYEVLINGVMEHLQGTPLQLIRDKFNEYILQRQKEGLSTRRLNLTIELSKRVFQHAIVTNMITADPLSGLQKFRNIKKIKRALKSHEIKALLDNSGKFKIIWLAFLHTGLRRSELVELKWKDVDLERGRITILKDLPGKGVGWVPMSEEIKTEFELFKRGKASDYVFTTKIGTPYRNNLMREFRRCLKKAGINQEGISIHSLRYTFATILASQNTHPKLIQTLLRHKSVSTSMDIYTDVYDKDISNTINNLKFL